MTGCSVHSEAEIAPQFPLGVIWTERRAETVDVGKVVGYAVVTRLLCVD